MRPFASFPRDPMNLVTPPQRLPRVRGRCILENRRQSPALHHSHQLINTVHITPTERIDPSGDPRQAGADLWPRDRVNPTQVTQLALAQFDVIRPHRNSGGVGSNFRFFVKSARVNVTKKSFSWASSAPTCTRDPPMDFQCPMSLLQKTRTFAGTPYSPRPEISSTCVAMALTANPDLP